MAFAMPHWAAVVAALIDSRIVASIYLPSSMLAKEKVSQVGDQTFSGHWFSIGEI